MLYGIEKIKKEYMELVNQYESLEAQKRILEQEYKSNTKKLSICIWILTALYVLLFLIQIYLYKGLPASIQSSVLELARVGKWVICGAAVFLFVIIKYNDGYEVR